MSANGIAELPTKEEKEIAKLNLAQAKRQGKTVARDGTVTGDENPDNQPVYRELNTYDIDLLPTKYDGNDVVFTSHPDGLKRGRPWIDE